MNRTVVRTSGLFYLVMALLCAGSGSAKADTITGVFSAPVLAGYVLLNGTTLSGTPVYDIPYYEDNTATAVYGTATPGGAACAGGNTLCWGSGADLGIPTSEQFSELSFTGSTTFNSTSGATQNIGTISFMNGTSDDATQIFGATLTLYDNGIEVGADTVLISTTSNLYSGTGLTPAELQQDADYINICGNDSNICGSSIEAYEASEGGTGLLTDLQGKLVGDPTLELDGATVDPSEANCTTCGIVGTEAAAAVTPEPSSVVLVATAMMLCVGLGYRARRTGAMLRM